jgi:hypothetical protein
VVTSHYTGPVPAKLVMGGKLVMLVAPAMKFFTTSGILVYEQEAGTQAILPWGIAASRPWRAT